MCARVLISRRFFLSSRRPTHPKWGAALFLEAVLGIPFVQIRMPFDPCGCADHLGRFRRNIEAHTQYCSQQCFFDVQSSLPMHFPQT